MDPRKCKVHFRVFEERETEPWRNEVTSPPGKAESPASKAGLTDVRVVGPHARHLRTVQCAECVTSVVDRLPGSVYLFDKVSDFCVT